MLVTALTLTACLDEVKISSPSAAHPETSLNATFYTKGNAIAPTVESNGNQGVFSLNTNTEAIEAIDAQNSNAASKTKKGIFTSQLRQGDAS